MDKQQIVYDAYFEAGEARGRVEGITEGKNESILRCVLGGIKIEEVANIFNVYILDVKTLIHKKEVFIGDHKQKYMGICGVTN